MKKLIITILGSVSLFGCTEREQEISAVPSDDDAVVLLASFHRANDGSFTGPVGMQELVYLKKEVKRLETAYPHPRDDASEELLTLMNLCIEATEEVFKTGENKDEAARLWGRLAGSAKKLSKRK